MTIWYAQNSSVNIDSTNEWNDVANGSGNFLTWASLGATDMLVANGKTGIAINVDFTCASITNAANSGTTAGQFTVTTASAARNIAANVIAQDTGTATTCLAATLHATNRLTITGNVTGGGVASSNAMTTATTSGLLTVTGTVTGGTASNAVGITSNAALIATVSGTITGGSGSSAHGIRHSNAGALTLTCVAVTAGEAPAILENASASTAITATGGITASSSSTPPPAITTSGIVTMGTGSSIVSNATSWSFPVAGRIKWQTTNTGMSITLYDASGTAHVLKVPDYPAEADVESGVTYDYTTKTGTLSASGGSCPVITAG